MIGSHFPEIVIPLALLFWGLVIWLIWRMYQAFLRGLRRED